MRTLPDVGTLSALFNYAKSPQRRWAAVNPCEGVELPGVPEHDEIRFLDEAEWEAVLRHVQSARSTRSTGRST